MALISIYEDQYSLMMFYYSLHLDKDHVPVTTVKDTTMGLDDITSTRWPRTCQGC